MIFFWAVNYDLSVCETLQYNSGIVVLLNGVINMLIPASMVAVPLFLLNVASQSPFPLFYSNLTSVKSKNKHDQGDLRVLLLSINYYLLSWQTS